MLRLSQVIGRSMGDPTIYLRQTFSASSTNTAISLREEPPEPSHINHLHGSSPHDF
jgi:hypothetical protein